MKTALEAIGTKRMKWFPAKIELKDLAYIDTLKKNGLILLYPWKERGVTPENMRFIVDPRFIEKPAMKYQRIDKIEGTAIVEIRIDEKGRRKILNMTILKPKRKPTRIRGKIVMVSKLEKQRKGIVLWEGVRNNLVLVKEND